MKADAIVYLSNTGHTEQYARMLGQALGLEACSLDRAASQLPDGSGVIYMGWIRASHVSGFSKAAKRFVVCAVCGVGLCDTGTLIGEVRKASSIPEDTPLFTLQGGLDRGRLTGVNKLMITLLSRGIARQKQRSAQDERMLELLSSDASFVRAENLREILNWYQAQCGNK